MSITTTTLLHTDDTTGTVWPTHYFQDEPHTEAPTHSIDIPASEYLAHEAWCFDGIDDIDRANPVDTLFAAWREEGILDDVPFAVTKEYVSACIRRKRWALAHVPAIGTELTIVDDSTSHYLGVGTKVVVIGHTQSGAKSHPHLEQRLDWGRRQGPGSAFYVRRAYDPVTGNPTSADGRYAALLVAERDVAPWWQPLPKTGDLVDYFPTHEGCKFYQPGPFTVGQVDLADGSFLITCGDRRRWIFARSDDTSVGQRSWSLHDTAASTPEEPAVVQVEVSMVPLAQVHEAITIIGEVYNQAADQRNWCSEADQVTRSVNAALVRAGLPEAFQLETRMTTISGYVEVNLSVPVRLYYRDVEVSAGATGDEREAVLREHFRNDDAYTPLGILDGSYGSDATIERRDVDWEGDVVNNAVVYVD